MIDAIPNRQLVSTYREYVVIQLPRKQMTKQEALAHAAWLVAVADDNNEFPDILKAIQNS